MFGMGGTEILVILIVALLFLGPDKLPDAAKKISKGIRDIKQQSRVLQRTIEEDEHIGGAIRDIKSALRGEYEPAPPKPIKPKKQLVEPAAVVAALPEPGTPEHGAGPDQPPEVAATVSEAPATPPVDAVTPPVSAVTPPTDAATPPVSAVTPPIDAATPPIEPSIQGPGPDAAGTAVATAANDKPTLTMPPTAGEPDEVVPAAVTASETAELAAMVKPAPNTIPHKSSSVTEVPEQAEPKHG